jgi:hypothetical protein
MPTENSDQRNITESVGSESEELREIHIKDLKAPIDTARVAVSIVQHEIERLRRRAESNLLDIVESKLLKDYILLLLQLHKSRAFPDLTTTAVYPEDDESELDLETLTQDDLAALTINAAKKMGYGIDSANGRLKEPKDEQS